MVLWTELGALPQLGSAKKYFATMKKMVIEVGNDGTAHIQALDLTGDAWRDYRHYLAEARSAEASGVFLPDTQTRVAFRLLRD